VNTSSVLTWGFIAPVIFSCPFCPRGCSVVARAHGPSNQLPAAAGDGGASAFLRGPASLANVIPLPGTVTSDTVRPGNAAEVTR
jgi:hypothetical protein